MTFDEYFEILKQSNREDWHVIHCWGMGTGPSFRQQFTQAQNGDNRWIEVQDYPLVATFKPDLMISMAFGYTDNPDFKEPWANHNPDPRATGKLMDFYYGSTLIHREYYVAVDGGRGELPTPKQHFGPDHKLTKLTVPSAQVRFYRMFNQFEANLDFDRYFEGTGFEITNDPWPNVTR